MPSSNAFRQAEDEYLRLRGKLVVTSITREQFETALKELVVKDAQGRYWSLGADSGKWNVFDGKSWIEAVPPSSQIDQTPVPPRSEVDWMPSPPPPRFSSGGMPSPHHGIFQAPPTPRGNSPLYLILGVGLIFILAVFCLALVFVTRSVPNPLTAFLPPSAKSGLPDVSSLSVDQRLVKSNLGVPAFFVVNVAPDESSGTPETIRHETWFYPPYRLSYTFVDGNYVGSNDLGVIPSQFKYPAVAPWQFQEGMSPDQVIQTVGKQPSGYQTIPASILTDAQFYLFDGMEAGFQRGRLVYAKSGPTLSGLTNLPPIDADMRPVFVDPSTFRLALSRPRRDAPVLALPPAKGKDIIDQGKNLWDWYSFLKGSANLVGLTSEISGAAKFLREQSQALQQQAQQESDPVKKAQLEFAAQRAVGRANGIESDVLPTLRAMQTGYACARFKCPDSLTSLFGGEKPDPERLRNLFNQYVGDVAGRPGQVREGLQNWLERLGGDFNNLPPNIRESIITDLIETKVRELMPTLEGCAGVERNSGDYAGCLQRATSRVINDLRNSPYMTGYQGCVDGFQGRVGGIPCPTRGGQTTKNQVQTSTPTVTQMPTQTPTVPLPTKTSTSTPTATPTSTAAQTSTSTPTTTSTPDTSWIDGYVDGIGNQLVNQGQNPIGTAIVIDDLRNCLIDAVRGGLSRSDAIARCSKVIKNIPTPTPTLTPTPTSTPVPPSLPQRPPGPEQPPGGQPPGPPPPGPG